MNIYSVDSEDNFKPHSENWEQSGNYDVNSKVTRTFLGIFKTKKVYNRSVSKITNKKMGY